MKQPERDELLIRLDERSESIIRELQDQNEHLVKLNGSVARNTTFRKTALYIGTPLLILFLTKVFEVW